MVGIEVPKDVEELDEEMVDYEATPERGDVTVITLSADYYIIEDDSAAAVFNFPMQDVVFKNLEQEVTYLKGLHPKGHINGSLI